MPDAAVLFGSTCIVLFGLGRRVMAAARDQAARIVRAGPETAEVEAAPEAGTPLADQLRTHVAEEARRRPAEAPGAPEAERPGAPPVGNVDAAAAKPGKRKFIMIGALGLLALAAIGYGVYSWSGASMSRRTMLTFEPTTPRLAPGYRATSRQSCPATIRSFAPAT
jgi:hypothetical protein